MQELGKFNCFLEISEVEAAKEGLWPIMFTYLRSQSLKITNRVLI